MNRYNAAEMDLAEMLGWQGVRTINHGNYPKGIPPEVQNPEHPDYNTIHRWHHIPRWVGNVELNMALMVEYRIQPQYYNTMYYLIAYQGIHPTTVYIDQHNNDRMLAFRYGVVLAVIQKLKEDKERV